MELLEKPIKTKLTTAAMDYFAQFPNSRVVGFINKDGREFWFRRDLRTNEVIKITRQEAEKL